MGLLQDIERRRALARIRGPERRAGKRRLASGPRFASLTAEQQAAIRDYARKAGPYWRAALLSACLRGASKHPRFEAVLCPLVHEYGARWLREVKVPAGRRHG